MILLAEVDAHQLTLGNYLDTWLTGKHALRPATRALYVSLVEHYLKPQLGAIRLLDLRGSHLDRFYAGLQTGVRGTPLSAGTIRRIHAVLRSALGTAVKRRLLPYNPAQHIELAPEDPRRPRPWTTEQCLTFLAATSQDRLAPMYQLLLTTGMRRGEAMGLRWEDVHLDDDHLVVSQQITEVRGKLVTGRPKTRNSVRVVALDDWTVLTLRRRSRSGSSPRP